MRTYCSLFTTLTLLRQAQDKLCVLLSLGKERRRENLGVSPRPPPEGLDPLWTPPTLRNPSRDSLP